MREGTVVAVGVVASVGCLAGCYYLWRCHGERKARALKPQLGFRKVLADNSDQPFQHGSPLPTPHSTLPTHETYALPNKETQGQHGSCEQEHPYHSTIRHLLENSFDALSHWRWDSVEAPPSVEESCWEWVGTPSRLRTVVAELEGLTALAVDVEHHAQHSYLGYTCLLQLSTGHKDYVVDAIALHDHMDLLRPLFADPTIVKVLHGAQNDCKWLQRDFHIYIVNMFDTQKACQVLQRESNALGSLLQAMCGVNLDKSFQLSDWRQRPLPEAHLRYARCDAHYLLFVASRLLRELLRGPPSTAQPSSAARHTLPETPDLPPDTSADSATFLGDGTSHITSGTVKSGPMVPGLSGDSAGAAAGCTARGTLAGLGPDDAPLLGRALKESQLRTLELYRKPTSQAAALASALKVLGSMNTPGEAARRGGEALRDCVYALCLWRDQMARAQDEGLQHILSNQALLAVAREACPTPEALLKRVESCSPPGLGVSSAVRGEAGRLCGILDDAVAGLLRAPIDGERERASVLSKRAAGRKEAGRRQRRVDKFSAKAPVYENARMLSRNGDLLCYCDLKKLQWYEGKGLAVRVSDSPPTIQLLFEHKTGDQDSGIEAFYMHSKANRCVACGEDSHYLRYKVVPACYRRHFPLHLKSHRSHDVVLLCVDCHEVAHKAAASVKQELAREYLVPLTAAKAGKAGPPSLAEDCADDTQRPHPYNVRRSAIALRRYGPEMPPQRRRELESLLLAYLGRPLGHVLSQVDMEAALMAGLNKAQRRKMQQSLARKSWFSPSSLTGSGIPQSGAPSEGNPSCPPEPTPGAAPAPTAGAQVSHETASPGTVSPEPSQRCSPVGQSERGLNDTSARQGDACVPAASVPRPPGVLTSSTHKGGEAQRDPAESGVLSSAAGRPGCSLGDPAEPEGRDGRLHAEGAQHASESRCTPGAAALDEAAASLVEAREVTGVRSSGNEEVGDPGPRVPGGGEDSSHMAHGKKVVEAAMAAGGEAALERLVMRFREAFVDFLQPRHLPAAWDVHHFGRREFGDYSVYFAGRSA